jgi:hypothetical protein
MLKPCVPLSEAAIKARYARRNKDQDQAGNRQDTANLARGLHHEHTTESTEIAAIHGRSVVATRGE